jgi:uncharacterized protein YwqG
MDIEKMLEEMQEYLPAQPALRFKIKAGEPGLFDSKIGGTPYFPKDMEYPCGKANVFANQPLFLLAQLNFEKMPSIPDFPKKGILQFFIAGDDLYGMSDDQRNGLTDQQNFRVIYHEDIITDETQLLSADEIPQYEGEEILLPFEGTYLLVPEQPEMMPPKAQDFRFEEAFLKVYNKYADEPCEDFMDLDEEIAEPLYDGDRENNPAAVIGGYPVFAQFDPREMDSYKDCDVLLFELDSHFNKEEGIEICWGDMGTGTFFIPRGNLKALDFSRVLYNYDCG